MLCRALGLERRVQPDVLLSANCVSGTELSRSRRERLRVDFAAAFEGAAERDLVGVLEVAADGQAARDPRHLDAERLQAAGRGTSRSLRLRCSGWSRGSPRRSLRRRCEPAAPSRAAARARCPRSARSHPAARGSDRGTRWCARSRRCRAAPRRRTRCAGRVARRGRTCRARLRRGCSNAGTTTRAPWRRRSTSASRLASSGAAFRR